MTSTPATSTVERDLFIQARPEIVFRLLTDPAEMLKWQGLDVQLEARPGGIYRCRMNQLGHTTLGRFVEVTPHSRIIFTWGWADGLFDIPPESTTVEITLAAEGSGTRLRLLHSGLPDQAPIIESHGMGWTQYLGRLAAVAEGRDPGPDEWASGAMGR